MFVNRLLTSNEHIIWLESSSWSYHFDKMEDVFCCGWVQVQLT